MKRTTLMALAGLLALLHTVQKPFQRYTRINSEMKVFSRVLKPNFVLAMLLAIASNPAKADQFYVTIGIQCSPSKDELTISFHGYWNEAGERAIALAGNNVIDPRSLVTFTQDIKEKYSIHTKSISKKCVIGKSKYEIDIKPLMSPRFHPEGFCATRIGAIVTVKEKGKLVVNEGVDACTEAGLVTTEISLSPDKPTFTKKIPAKEFYAD